MSVLVEVERSAAPPTRCGTRSAAHWIAAPDALRVAIDSPASKRGGSASKPSGMRPSSMSENAARLVGEGLAVGLEALRPLALELGAALAALAEVGEGLLRHEEVRVRVPAVVLLGLAHVLLAERRAVRLRRVLQRAAVADVRLDDDQRGLPLDRHRLARDALEPLDREVLADVDYVPAVGLEALAHVLGHHDVDLAGELDAGWRRSRRSGCRARGGRRTSRPRTRLPPGCRRRSRS